MRNFIGSVGLLLKSLCYNIKGKQKQNKSKEKKMEETVHKSSSNEIAPNVFQMKKKIPEFSMFNFAKYCLHLPNPEQFIWKTLLNKSKTDENRWQNVNTPDEICNEMVNMYKPNFSVNDKILVLFNLELIKALALNYENLIYSNVYFIADSEKDFYWIKKNFNLINIVKLETFNIECLMEKIGEFNVRKFDIVFSNPPYANTLNVGLDLKIMKPVLLNSSSVIFIQPSAWALRVVNKMKIQKEIIDLTANHIKSLKFVHPSKVFGNSCKKFEPLVISLIDLNKNYNKIKINDDIHKTKYDVDNISDVNMFSWNGDWKNYVKPFLKKLHDYEKSHYGMADKHITPHSEINDFSILLPMIKGNAAHKISYNKEGKGKINKNFCRCLNKDWKDNLINSKSDIKERDIWTFSFETEEELHNFIHFLDTKIVRFCQAIFKVDGNVNMGHIPWMESFKFQIDDKDLIKILNLTNEEWNFINNYICDLD